MILRSLEANKELQSLTITKVCTRMIHLVKKEVCLVQSRTTKLKILKEIQTKESKKRKKKKKRKNKNKKYQREKESTVLGKYEQGIEGKQEEDNPDLPVGHFDNGHVTNDTGNIIAADDIDGKEAAQDAPGKYVSFLSTHESYDHSKVSDPNPSSEFPPDNPDSTQKNHHDHYQHHHGGRYHETNTGTEIETDASFFYNRLHVGNNDQNVSSEVPESLLVVDDVMTAVVTSAVLHNNDHYSNMDSRAATTIGRGSGDGVTGDVEVDIGILPICKRRLNSVGEDCDVLLELCFGFRPKIQVSGTAFQTEVTDCIDGNCPHNLPIGCWDTSEVTNMASAFSNTQFDESINCWNTARVANMQNMFYYASNFNQSLDDWDVKRVTTMYYMFNAAASFNQPLNGWNVKSVTYMGSMF